MADISDIITVASPGEQQHLSANRIGPKYYTTEHFPLLARPISVLQLTSIATTRIAALVDPKGKAHFRCLRDICTLDFDNLHSEKDIGPKISGEVRQACQQQGMLIGGRFTGDLEPQFARFLELKGIVGSRTFTTAENDLVFLGLDLRALPIIAQTATALSKQNIFSILDLVLARDYVLVANNVLSVTQSRTVKECLRAHRLCFDMPIPRDVVGQVDDMIVKHNCEGSRCLPVIHDMPLFLQYNPLAAYVLAQTKKIYTESQGTAGFCVALDPNHEQHVSLGQTARWLVQCGLLLSNDLVLALTDKRGHFAPYSKIVAWRNDQRLDPIFARALKNGPRGNWGGD